MSELEKKTNMKLWNEVCETDPGTTKQVNQRGGFTAIAAQNQIKRATELWGVYGIAWGVKGLKFGELRGDGVKIDEITVEGVFWYPEGSFEMATDIAYRPGNDSRKKLLTDLTTKALSKLGFNSDVFEGLFDDNKYVAQMQKKFGNGGDIGEAKTALLNHLKDKMRMQSITADHDSAVDVAVAITQSVLGVKVLTTKDEIKQIRTAIDSGDYALDTGQRMDIKS